MTTARLAARRPWVLLANLPNLRPGSTLAAAASDRRRALQLALGVIWLLDAALQYQPFMFTKGFVVQIIQNSASGNPAVISPSAVRAMLSGMETGEPGWIKALDGFLSNALGQHATIAAITISVLCWLAATTVISGRFNRAAVIIAAVLGAAFWVAEDFGAIFTGQGTDPNSGLLLIVLAAAFWRSAPPAITTRPSIVRAISAKGG